MALKTVLSVCRYDVSLDYTILMPYFAGEIHLLLLNHLLKF